MNRLKPLSKCFSVLFILGILLGCEEQTDWDFQPQNNGILVVEAIITNELKRQELRLSLSYDDQNGIPLPVTDAEVSVSGGGASVRFWPDPNDPGRYVTLLPVAAQLHVPYTLEINWNGTIYTAQNEMVGVRPFEKPPFQPVGDTDIFTLGEVAPMYLPDEQAMYEVDIVWSHLTGSEADHVKMFFYTFNTIDISELFRPERESVVFPKGSIVVERKYSLNPEFAAYLRALLMETEWQGGFFDEASGSLPTNVSNGGLGFFAVCAFAGGIFVVE